MVEATNTPQKIDPIPSVPETPPPKSSQMKPEAFVVQPAEPEQPTRPSEVALFNGQNLDGWTPVFFKNSKSRTNTSWTADAARGILASSGGDWVDLQTDRTFKNFVLTLEWRFTPGGFVGVNGSGIVVRSTGVASDQLNPRGVEIDLREGKNEANGIGTGCFIAYQTTLKNHRGGTDGGVTIKNRHLGWLREPPSKPRTEWNTCEITCNDDRITVRMNGVLVNEGWGAEVVAGHICLRNQNAEGEFRNIRLRNDP